MDDIIKVVELSERYNGDDIFEMVPKRTNGACKAVSVPKGERRHSPKVGKTVVSASVVIASGVALACATDIAPVAAADGVAGGRVNCW